MYHSCILINVRKKVSHAGFFLQQYPCNIHISNMLSIPHFVDLPMHCILLLCTAADVSKLTLKNTGETDIDTD